MITFSEITLSKRYHYPYDNIIRDDIKRTIPLPLNQIKTWSGITLSSFLLQKLDILVPNTWMHTRGGVRGGDETEPAKLGGLDLSQSGLDLDSFKNRSNRIINWSRCFLESKQQVSILRSRLTPRLFGSYWNSQLFLGLETSLQA